MKLQYFQDVQNVKELKKAYHKLVLKNHPDKGGDHEVMVAIVLEYEWALAHLFDEDGNRKGGKQGGAKANTCYDFQSDEFRTALDQLMKLDGLELEVCGDWIWISGNTFQNKTAIKEIGCRWASKKKLWYWRPADYVKKTRKALDMDQIRNLHGSEVFTSNGRKVLTA